MSLCDWSSDVCSSELGGPLTAEQARKAHRAMRLVVIAAVVKEWLIVGVVEIGRASCREREMQAVGARAWMRALREERAREMRLGRGEGERRLRRGATQ